MVERLVTFKVFGQEYPLYTDAPEEDVQEIMQLVKSQLEDIAHSATHVLPPNKVAILTSLNMAGKYVKLKREFNEYRHKVEQYFDQLHERLEEDSG